LNIIKVCSGVAVNLKIMFTPGPRGPALTDRVPASYTRPARLSLYSYYIRMYPLRPERLYAPSDSTPRATLRTERLWPVPGRDSHGPLPGLGPVPVVRACSGAAAPGGQAARPDPVRRAHWQTAAASLSLKPPGLSITVLRAAAAATEAPG
jgi:hypothetical protein